MKKLTILSLLIVNALLIVPMSTGCTKAGSGEDEIVENISKDDTSASSESSSSPSSSSSDSKSLKDTTSADSKSSTTEITTQKDSTLNADSAIAPSDGSGDKASDTATSAEESTKVDLSENKEKAADSSAEKPSEKTSDNKKESTKKDSKKEEKEIKEEVKLPVPNEEGMALAVDSSGGNVTFTQGDSWSISYDGEQAKPLKLSQEKTALKTGEKNVEITYPEDGLFSQLEVYVSGNGNIVSKGHLSGNVLLSCDAGNVEFDSKYPLEEYTLLLNSVEGSIDVNGENVEDVKEGYNTIGTTDKFVIAQTNTGKIKMTFNK